MDFTAIISVIIAILILYIIFKVTKKILFTIILFLIIVFVVAGVFGLVTYTDFQNFKEGMESGEKLFLLADQDKFITGLSIVTFKEDSNPETISEEQLAIYSQHYQNNNLDSILEDRFKVLIFKKEVIENNLQGDFSEQGLDLTKQQALDILNSDESLQEYYTSNDFGDISPYELRASIFLISIFKIQDDNSPVLLLEEYKKGNIIIYEDSMVLKILRKIPTSQVSKVIEKQTIQKIN